MASKGGEAEPTSGPEAPTFVATINSTLDPRAANFVPRRPQSTLRNALPANKQASTDDAHAVFLPHPPPPRPTPSHHGNSMALTAQGMSTVTQHHSYHQQPRVVYYPPSQLSTTAPHQPLGLTSLRSYDASLPGQLQAPNTRQTDRHDHSAHQVAGH